MSVWLFKSIYFLFVLCCFLIVLSLWGFYSAIRPFKIKSQITPAHFNLQYEKVSFRTKDGLLLRGWFIPSKRHRAKTIIALHGYPADKGDILPAVVFLHPQYNLLLFDFRYLGESEGPYTTIGLNEVEDLRAAIQFLQNRGTDEVAVWGFSMGGAVALMAAPKTPEIKAIVAQASYARLDWMAAEYYPFPIINYPLAFLTRIWAWLILGYNIEQVAPAESVKHIYIPLLIIHSQQDNVVSFKHALLLQQKLKHNIHAKFIFVNEGLHGALIRDHEKTISQFFEKNF